MDVIPLSVWYVQKLQKGDKHMKLYCSTLYFCILTGSEHCLKNNYLIADYNDILMTINIQELNYIASQNVTFQSYWLWNANFPEFSSDNSLHCCLTLLH